MTLNFVIEEDNLFLKVVIDEECFLLFDARLSTTLVELSLVNLSSIFLFTIML